ncbi:MAG TPA: FtsK/SpoIIIE domain-containing protein [Verrucomicrobiota bacterium]|nr:FtsK/SpoIIIE domain-containing protein [Verrucomicrobiota bacterium]
MLSEEQLAGRISEEASATIALCQRGREIGSAIQAAIDAEAAEQLRRSHAALEDALAKLRNDHKTALAKDLARLQIPEVPSQAEWTSPSFRTYSERANGGIETASLHLGSLAFKVQAWHIRIPLRLELLNHCNLILICEQECRPKAVSILQSLLLRTLVTVVPGKMLLRCFDATEHGRAFSAFLQQLPTALTEGKAGFDTRDFDMLMAGLEARVAFVAQRLLNAATPTLWCHNTASKGDLEPYYAVAIDNVGDLDKDRTQRILKLMKDGPQAGLFTILTSQNLDPIRKCPAGQDVIQSSLIITLTKSGIQAEQGGVRLNREFELDRFPDATTADGIFSSLTALHKRLSDETVPFIPGPPAQWSTGDCLAGIDIPIGHAKAGGDLHLVFNEDAFTGALVVGSSGQGKSNLLHVIIARLMLAYAPSHLNLFLLDLKGTEFNLYEKVRLPHIKMILSDMSQKLGLAILREFDNELTNRKKRLAAQRAQKLSDYNKSAPTHSLPRLVIVIDEFQKLFTGDMSLSREAETLTTNLLRQGRSYGVHLIMASQNLSPQTTPRDIKTMFPIKIVLKFNTPSDYTTVLEDNHDLATQLTKPGQAAHYDGAGPLKQFIIPFLPFKDLDPILNQLGTALTARGEQPSELVFLNGEEESDVRRNTRLLNAITRGGTGEAIQIWLGDAFSLTGTASIFLRRQKASNLLIGCQERHFEPALQLACLSMLAVLAHNNKTSCYIFQRKTPLTSATLQALTSAFPTRIHTIAEDDVEAIHELAKTIKDLDHSAQMGPALLLFPGLHKFHTLGTDFHAIYNRPVTRAPAPAPTVAESLQVMLEKGPTVGFHSFVLSDAPSKLDRNTLANFNLRIAFRLADTDSLSLFQGNYAVGLPDGLAVVADRDESSQTQEFRPYITIDPAWLDNQIATLKTRQIPA